MSDSVAGPKVSVVIPFLNREAFLADAIDSVRAQTYADWELLLVDDGSSDRSTTLAKACAASSGGRITYLEHPRHANRGMPTSRNLGIRHARGKYIANLDSDDVWRDSFLATFVPLLDENPTVAMTFGPMTGWNTWTQSPGMPADWIQSLTVPTDEILPPPRFVPPLLSGRNDPQGCVMRRSAVIEVGYYEETLQMCEDWALYIKLALKYPVLPTSSRQYWYRQHPGQYCTRLSRAGMFHRQFLPFIAWLQAYLAGVGSQDRALWAAVSRLRWRNRLHRGKERIKRALRAIQRTDPTDQPGG
jgi:glycosyltransferase involved in cell wall biosynthesis